MNYQQNKNNGWGKIYKEEVTGNLYGSLFTALSDQLFQESVDLFFQRHKRWGIDLNWFQDKICLDGGCGGGRYLVALARLGAREIIGIDISPKAVQEANERLRVREITRAKAIEASVLAIPSPDNYFDYVVCSGVIHHTSNPRQAFLELHRVLKSGGKLFLSVYGRGGLVWVLNDIFRYTICKIIPFKLMERIWTAVNIPANKRYNYLDNLYVPYCHRFTEKEIRKWLESSGYTNIRRVKFERYDYEKFWSRVKYGEGWLQFYADKI